MSQRIVIDSLAFAREARSLEGELPIAGFSRIQDLLTSSNGTLKYCIEGRTVRGRAGGAERPQFLLEIEGRFSICCQRCLEGISYSLKIENVLEFIGNEEVLTQEEIEDESIDFLPVQKEIDVVSLIEDEVILKLPVALRHEDCVLPEMGRAKTEKISPFDVLKALKNGGKQ